MEIYSKKSLEKSESPEVGKSRRQNRSRKSTFFLTLRLPDFTDFPHFLAFFLPLMTDICQLFDPKQYNFSQMKDFSYITNSHPAYIESLYNDFVKDPSGIDPDLKKFFEGFDFAVSNGTQA